MLMLTKHRISGIFSQIINSVYSLRPFQHKKILYGIMAETPKLKTVIEGKANIVHPASVFYNPVQEFNRDLTIAILSCYAEERIKEKKAKQDSSDTETDELLVPGKKYEDGLRILEGLAASGLRSMRFGLEVPGVKEIIANDFDSNAVQIIKENITRNNLEHLVKENHADVGLYMYQSKSGIENQFDVIDLDPYGSPAQFLDPCMQALKRGGLLCVTCTDAAVLCGNFPEKCYQHYGGLPVKGAFCHEMALRIILHSIQSHAARYQKYIVPVLSLSIDFYFRLFLIVHYKPSIAKFAASNTGLLYNCSGCGSYTVQPLATYTVKEKSGEKFFSAAHGPSVPERCEHCGHAHRVGGPLYIASLHDREFVNKVLMYVREHPAKFKTLKRIEGMLCMALEEEDFPLYYELDELCKVIHCSPLKMMHIRSAILNAGYKVSFSHANKNSIKTNAPNSLIWDIIRKWVKDNPVNPKRLEPGSVTQQILGKEPTTEVNFDLHPDANPASRALNLVRHQINPEKNWGPKPKARKDYDGDDLEERRLKNQGKKRKRMEEGAEDVDENGVEEM